MKREVVELVEAARRLEIRVAPKPDNPRAIRISGSRAEFPDRLYRVAVALAAVDRAGAAALDGTSDPASDAARLRMALDGVFRWMRSCGMDVAEPHAIVANALGVQSQQKSKRFRPQPKFACDRPVKYTNERGKDGGFTKNVKPRPLLKLAPGPGEKITLDALRRKAFEVQTVQNIMGAAGAR